MQAPPHVQKWDWGRSLGTRLAKMMVIYDLIRARGEGGHNVGHNNYCCRCSQFSAHLGGSAFGVVSQMRPRQPDFQYHAPNQTQHCEIAFSGSCMIVVLKATCVCIG